MKSLRSKLFCLLLFMTLVPMLVATAYSYQISNKSISVKVNDTSMAALKIISKSIDNELLRLTTEMEYVTSSYEFHHAVNKINSAETDGEEWLAMRAMDSLMLGIFSNTKAVKGMYISLPSGEHYAIKNNSAIKTDSLSQYSWFQSKENNTGALTYCGPVPIDGNRNALMFGRVVRDSTDRGNLAVIASVHFAIEPSFIIDISASGDLNQISSLMIFDANDRLIGQSDVSGTENEKFYRAYYKEILKNGLGSFYIEEPDIDQIMLYYVSDIFRYRIVQLIPYFQYSNELWEISALTLIFSASCLLLTIVITFFLSRNISHPIRILNQAMKYTETGNLDIFIPSTRKDEIGQITRRFNKMVVHLKQVFDQSIKDEKVKKQLEINALQYQINPHFLYNTLASVRSLTLLENAPKSAQMISALSKLLKSTVAHAGMLISLEQEIENISLLLFIQNTCLGGCIEYEIHLEEGTKSCLIPNLLLQPIVENAVFYGANPQTGRIEIEISAKLWQEVLLLTIRDHGPGISSEQQMKIFDSETKSDIGNSLNHIGLKNINQRIKLNFGESYGLLLNSSADGAEVQLRLPIITTEKSDNGDVCL